MKRFLVALMGLCAFTCAAVAQNLPAGSLGIVNNNTPNTWQTFTYSFTPSTTGANFVGFAFRQDPAFWTFDNVRLTAAGSSTNLLTNGAFDTGGQFSVTTTNGPSSMQAPTNWGVWYQNGTYPAAAGTWTNVGGTHGGVWYDGAVGSFDGIYQGVALQAGTTYTISFEVSGNHAADNGAVQLGIYGGACATVSIAPNQCMIPPSAGFTTLATPEQGAAAGNPTPPTPTIVSELPGTPSVSSSSAPGTLVVTTASTRGTSTTTVARSDAAARSVNNINVTRTTVTTVTTPVTTVTTRTTPIVTTTTTIPRTVTTWSDGTTTTADGTPVVTRTTTNQIVTSSAVANDVQSTTGTQSQSVSAGGAKSAVSYRNNNPFIVDTLSQKDGAWISPSASYYKSVGSMSSGGIAAGYQWTVENNTFGTAFAYNSAKSGGLVGSDVQVVTYDGVAYALSKQDGVWFKGTVGYGYGDYTTNTSIPLFALYNTGKMKQKSYVADLTLYSAADYIGFRPLIGATINKSQIEASAVGSPLLDTTGDIKSTTTVNPYVGARYDFTDSVGIEMRATQTKDFKTVGGIRAVAKTELFDGVFLNATVGLDKGTGYQAASGTLGIKVAF